LYCMMSVRLVSGTRKMNDELKSLKICLLNRRGLRQRLRTVIMVLTLGNAWVMVMVKVMMLMSLRCRSSSADARGSRWEPVTVVSHAVGSWRRAKELDQLS